MSFTATSCSLFSTSRARPRAAAQRLTPLKHGGNQMMRQQPQLQMSQRSTVAVRSCVSAEWNNAPPKGLEGLRLTPTIEVNGKQKHVWWSAETIDARMISVEYFGIIATEIWFLQNYGASIDNIALTTGLLSVLTAVRFVETFARWSVNFPTWEDSVAGADWRTDGRGSEDGSTFAAQVEEPAHTPRAEAITARLALFWVTGLFAIEAVHQFPQGQALLEQISSNFM